MVCIWPPLEAFDAPDDHADGPWGRLCFPDPSRNRILSMKYVTPEGGLADKGGITMSPVSHLLFTCVLAVLCYITWSLSRPR
jgi:hypothetical protein